MFFRKKLYEFLTNASKANVIDSKTKNNLEKYYDENANKSIILNNLNKLIYIVGAVLLSLGVILIISSNWENINDYVKLGVYFAILSGVAISAIKIPNKNISNILYFLQSGLIIAGIGLIAQIYHLSSDSGTAYLIWFLLTLPLAYIVKYKWLNVLTLFAFCLWFGIFTSYLDLFDNNSLVYCSIFVFIPYFYAELDSTDNYWFLRKIVYFSLILFFYISLFMDYGDSIKYLISNNWTTYLTYAIILLGILFVSRENMNLKNIQTQKHLIVLLALISPMLLLLKHNWAFLIFTNIYFIGISIWAIYFGIKKLNKSYINMGMFFLFLYIITKFFDYFSSMLTTGSGFLIIGFVLIGLGYGFEKSRRKLIGGLNEKQIII